VAQTETALAYSPPDLDLVNGLVWRDSRRMRLKSTPGGGVVLAPAASVHPDVVERRLARLQLRSAGIVDVHRTAGQRARAEIGRRLRPATPVAIAPETVFFASMRDRSPEAHDPVFPENEADVLARRSRAFGGPSVRRDVVDERSSVGLGSKRSMLALTDGDGEGGGKK